MIEKIGLINPTLLNARPVLTTTSKPRPTINLLGAKTARIQFFYQRLPDDRKTFSNPDFHAQNPPIRLWNPASGFWPLSNKFNSQ